MSTFLNFEHLLPSSGSDEVLQHMSKVSHHDEERAGVSSTARAVAAFRALETKKGPDALIRDPFAAKLAGSMDAIKSSLSDNQIKNIEQKYSNLSYYVDLVAVRTKYIDDELEIGIKGGIRQVVILGAGLDSRAYRLESLRSLSVYEVDFPEVLQVKAKLLADDIPISHRIEVQANLGLPSWPETLKSAGYKTNEPAFWVLEGLTGYLTESELRELFQIIKNLSSTGSKMIVTFVGTSGRLTNQLHKFLTDSGDTLLQEYSWKTTKKSIFEVGELYGRSEEFKNKAYWLVTASS